MDDKQRHYDQKPLRIGTRNSPLARKQAQMLCEALSMAHPNLTLEVVTMTSAADWKKQDGEKSLCEQAGGKGQFATEIEQAHLADKIDCGVHSLKDMASVLPEGLVINHVLPRADARDAFISLKYSSIDELPQGATVGTCSPRRKAIALSKRPDLKIVPFRGNVQTRLDKVRSGQVDATFLAMAGLRRLGIEDEMIHPLSIDQMLPACGQGVVCMETRASDATIQDIFAAVHCTQTGLCAVAERAVLRVLDGSCHTPIAAYAVMEGAQIYLKAQVLSIDGQQSFAREIKMACANKIKANDIGEKLAQDLKAQLPAGILA